MPVLRMDFALDSVHLVQASASGIREQFFGIVVNSCIGLLSCLLLVVINL